MSERVTMPALGESVTEGTVTRWLKSVGDQVEVDEPLLEVSTDKVDTEIPSPVAGTLQEVLVQEDETVEVGADLAVIGEGAPSGEGDQSQGSGQQQAAEPAQEEQSQPAAQDESSSGQAQAQQAQAQPAQGGGQPSAGSGGSGGDGGGEKVTMPALGESVTEGTVTRWLKSEGDQVEVDEPLLEVSTDKVDTEIPSPVAGTLTKILVGEDETVEVGADLAIVGGSGGGQAGGGEQAGRQAGDGQEAGGGEQAGGQAGDGQKAGLAQEAQQQEQAEQQSQQAASPTQAAPQPSQAQQSQQAAPQPQQPQPQPKAEGDGGREPTGYVTPLVRKLAAENDIDLASITGTGVGGRIRKKDILDAAQARQQPAEPAPSAQQQAQPAAGGGRSAEAVAAIAAKRGTTEKMSRLRKVIAQRMVESLQVSAQLTTVVEVDVTKIARLRDRTKREFEAREGVKLSFLPFFALATVEALKEHPNVNASVEGDNIVYHAQENLGMAVDTDRGLLVPVIKDAGELNIAGLAKKIADLAERTRTNKVSPDELGGGTFTLTNTGSRGALFDTPIINQPQVGILGTGAVVKRPVVVTDPDGGETLAIRSMAYLALSYDHRIVDGADAARFLNTVKQRLEDGQFEV
ncbi:MAG TPA: 2-oxoglutarate dehydrogenase, E2 component, dihydrolipoamide succinyltransferase [Segeticoccus sp.]|uniref:2-oxoglutarate dehydrogenase, E2 component, dihydrolipoamide succinyltransferase n=1 Tax=Segeticoccus sp. TaxID=2706531 RepID=UPI002D7F7195|nr:2-oxoglutarate dehydrogenase, E2 component, dihydrolipoamide succinyltransferase [Segeticoccus sp.]HET8600372.1 2-oxoglutarate dehydrogenase, E2 component, dihydrolipoamide succinyltransferase [Segeticoccus sp.]